MSIFNIFSHKENKIGICQFAILYIAKSRKSSTYRRRKRNLVSHLKRYETSLGFELTSENINYQLMEGFAEYMKDCNLRKNTISDLIQELTYFLRKMIAKGYKIDMQVFDFHESEEEVTTVALTMEEIKRIYETKSNKESIRIIRDLFVVGCLTGMRYSDYSNLTLVNISGNLITRKTKKTGTTVSVPIHHIVRDILTKYNGSFPIYRDSSQNFNKVIKQICKRAGVNSKILVEYTKGHNVIRKSYKKYELVGSHTARRSFATNAYLAGIPTARIMLMTGHKTESSFFKYIRIQKKENAEILSQHPFFK